MSKHQRRWRRLLLLLGLVVTTVFAGASCNPGTDPPGDGTLQLFYDVNVDAAAAMGLADLTAIVVQSDGLTAQFSGPGGPTLVLNSSGGTTTLPAHDRLLPGPSYAVAPGFVTQLRIVNPVVTFQFTSRPALTVRVPSGPESGWKVVADESSAPNGYQIVAGKTTGVRLLVTLSDIFHKTGTGNGTGNSQTWMARPTIDSTLYNIIASGGYDPDIIVVVFDPATSDATIESAISAGNYTVLNKYPTLPKLYKLKLPPGDDLQAAHMYFRTLSYVLAAGPSVVMTPRNDTVPPTEGIAAPLAEVDAVTGWNAEVAANVKGRGTVGVPDAVIAEISQEGINTHHERLLPNIWLNQGEIVWKCPLSTCDVDTDGFVTLRDFNSPAFNPSFLPKLPQSHTGPITCDDLLAPGSGYSDGVDNDGNGFVDDICGWNFGTQTCPTTGPCTGGGIVLSVGGGCVSGCVPEDSIACAAEATDRADAHDTEVAGIIAAQPDMTSLTSPHSGDGVGVCWNCRLMVLAGMLPETNPQSASQAMGFTFEFLSAIAYATQNGAHVANYSAGAFLQPSNQTTCPSQNTSVDKQAFATVKNELDSLLSSTLSGAAQKAGNIPPLFTLSVDDHCGAVADDKDPNNYDYPAQAFRDTTFSQFALLVSGSLATATCVGPCPAKLPLEPFDAALNHGGDIAAPDGFFGVLDDTTTNGRGCLGAGSSFAAPLVAGVAGLVVSGNLAMFATPNGAALRNQILAHDVVTNPLLGSAVSSNLEITMTNLP